MNNKHLIVRQNGELSFEEKLKVVCYLRASYNYVYVDGLPLAATRCACCHHSYPWKGCYLK